MNFRKILQIIKFVVGWPISVVAIIFIAKTFISDKDVFQTIHNVDISLLFLGLAVLFQYFFLRALIWQKLINNKGSKFNLKNSAYLWEASEIKRFAPGFIWPMVSKTMYFSSQELSKKDLAYLLLTETQAFIMGTAAVSLLSIPFAYKFLPVQGELKIGIISAISAAVLTYAAVFIFGAKTRSLWGNNKYANGFRKTLPDFSTWGNIKIALLSAGASFAFSAGTYLVISSITFLTPAHFLGLLGLFSLAFLVGYLSIFVPLGLGVREGVIALGLSALMPLPIASAASIYARLGLIISELIFFQFTIISHNNKHRRFIKVWDFVSSHKQELLVGTAMVAYIIYFGFATFMRYDNFYTGRYDLGNMDQVVWNTSRGRIFQTSSDTGIMVSRLSDHADFILILIAPLYKLWADPRVLLLLQTIILSLGAIFVYKIAKLILGSRNAAAVFSCLYLLNPAVQYANLYDFHPVTLATTFLLGAFYFFLKKKYIPFLFFALLAAITKEQVWIVIAIFGFYLFFFEIFKAVKKKKTEYAKFNLIFGLGLGAACIAIFLYLVNVSIPNARGAAHFALSYYSDFGDSPVSILKNALLSPTKLLGDIFSKGSLSYLAQLFFPLGFTSAFSPLALVFALPDLGIDILSSNPNLHQIYYQYSATITPFIFISSIFAISNLNKWTKNKISINSLLILITITSIVSAYTFGPLPGARRPNIDMFTKQLADRQLIQSFISGVPTRYTVAATNNIGSHLSRRRNLTTIPVGVDNADIVVFLLNDSFAQPSLAEQKKMVGGLKKNKNYQLLFSQGDFYAFQKASLNYKSNLGR